MSFLGLEALPRLLAGIVSASEKALFPFWALYVCWSIHFTFKETHCSHCTEHQLWLAFEGSLKDQTGGLRVRVDAVSSFESWCTLRYLVLFALPQKGMDVVGPSETRKQIKCLKKDPKRYWKIIYSKRIWIIMEITGVACFLYLSMPEANNYIKNWHLRRKWVFIWITGLNSMWWGISYSM